MSNALTIDYDKKLKKLTVRGATTFPRVIFDRADDIEILDMSFGELTTLPDDLGRLRRMRVAFFSYNPFEEVPEVLSTCPALVMIGMKSCGIKRWGEQALPTHIQGITFTDNRLTRIPGSVGQLQELKKLVVTGNYLEALPRELLHCRQLELLRAGANRLTASPDWLFVLPSLAWYSEAGNPFCKALSARPLTLKTLSWHDLSIGEQIGQSAKNVVYKAVHKQTGQAVAIKLYGDELSTDGYTVDEITANVAAGSHPHLMSAIAMLKDVPDNKQGLALSLVPSNFTSVGLQPDFTTLTRDVFPGRNFSPSFTLQVLQDVCSALVHLHGRGMMHGDVYAHNLLADRTGSTYMGDFGAATLYEPLANHRREQLEVRSFGYLLDDLLTHSDQKHKTLLERLDSLRQSCLQSQPDKRPLFGQIADELSLLAT